MGTVQTELGTTMNALLVLSVASMAAAAPQFFYGHPGHALTYTYTPQVTKLVPKEVAIEVPHVQYGIKETGCTNVFGFNVPCSVEGEARRKSRLRCCCRRGGGGCCPSGCCCSPGL